MPLSEPMPLLPEALAEIVRNALKEDLGAGDVTTEATMFHRGQARAAKARIFSKEPAIVAGIVVAQEVWKQVDPRLIVTVSAQDGEAVSAGGTLMEIQGSAASISTGERTALNFLQQLSGVSTKTRLFVEQTQGTKARIVDTRKTIAGLRILQKYAVRCGGGLNHRAGLYDQYLFKDNHLALSDGTSNLADAIHLARKLNPALLIEVEADRIDQVHEIIPLRPDIILLDNMSLEETAACVKLMQGSGILAEASGNMSLERIKGVSQTGVDYISVGALTHSVQAIDLSLEICAT